MTAPTMRERVARAICRDGVEAANRAIGIGAGPSWVQEQVDARWHHYEDVAGDVLTAMREPTKAMLTAGEDEGDEGSHGYWAYADPTHTWHAMIDAALAEKP